MPSRIPKLSRHDCYEHCVQDGERMARFLQAVHDGARTKGARRSRGAQRAITLREDFAGSAGVCRAWIALGPHHHAIAVDMDAEPLHRAAGIPRLRPVRADVRRCAAKADIISATNFPIGYWHTRGELIRYLRVTRARLKPGGVFVCDTYLGPTALTPGVRIHRTVPYAIGGHRLTIRQTWEQREADAATNLVTDVLHFEVLRKGRIIQRLPDAFVYRWRLWSIPELRDALNEIGFRRVDLYNELVGAVDHTGAVHVRPLETRAPLHGDHVIWLAAHR